MVPYICIAMQNRLFVPFVRRRAIDLWIAHEEILILVCVMKRCSLSALEGFKVLDKYIERS
jgi:hypothetical protein